MGLGSLFDRSLAAMLPIVPKGIVRKVAWRYVAGETLDEALSCVRKIEAMNACATIDVLGEEIENIGQGEEAFRAYRDLLEAMEREKLDANISIKLTAFGLRLDSEKTYERVRALVEDAQNRGNFVRIDMEDSSTTTETLDVYRRLRSDGFDNVGVVLQAYMRRSEQDVNDLAGQTPSYRLCKGIYVEREEIAIQEYGEIRANYLRLLEQMLKGGSHVGIATHDHYLVDEAESLIKKLGLGPEAYEFQMLLGVDEPLAKRLVANGHRLRIYVPYGRDWYAYCVRRLKENPRIGRYILLGMFKK